MIPEREILFWTGHHSKELLSTLNECWNSKQLLVLCPPHLKDPSIFSKLPKGNSQFLGNWEGEEKALLKEKILEKRRSAKYALEKDFSQAQIGLFTSGSSLSKPRLALYSKDNVLSSLRAIGKVFDSCQVKNIFAYPQPHHTFGLCLGYLNAIVNNLEINFFEGAYSSKAHECWLKNIDKHSLTLGTPVHFLDLIKYLNENKIKAPASLTAIVGGAAVDVKLWEKLQNTLHIEKPSVGYGCTEASPGISHLAPGLKPENDGEIGELLENVKIEEQTHEGYFFSGPSLCWGLEQSTGLEHPTRTLIKDDIQLLNEGNRWVFKGRKDFLLNRGGEKFSLEAIETVLFKELEIQTLGVGVKNDRLGEELSLLVEESSLSNASTFDIQNTLKAHTGRSFAAEYIFFCEKLPMTPSHKKDRIEGKKLADNLVAETSKEKLTASQLSNFLPHRAPAVWVSSVEWSNTQSGCVSIDTKSEAVSNCLDSTGALRGSSFIEWMAQSFGFIQASRQKNGKGEGGKAYLVAFKGAKFSTEAKLLNSEKFYVRCRKTFELGPISLVKCEVSNAKFQQVAQAELRLLFDASSAN